MAVKKKGRRASSLKVRVKRDPIGTVKTEINKTGWGKYIIGATLLGMFGGSQMASQMTKIPVVGGILSVAASKGARLVSGAPTYRSSGR